jgi:hypothetical protein
MIFLIRQYSTGRCMTRRYGSRERMSGSIERQGQKDRDEEQGKKAKRRGMNRKKPPLIAMIKKLLLFVRYNG